MVIEVSFPFHFDMKFLFNLIFNILCYVFPISTCSLFPQSARHLVQTLINAEYVRAWHFFYIIVMLFYHWLFSCVACLDAQKSGYKNCVVPVVLCCPNFNLQERNETASVSPACLAKRTSKHQLS